MRISSVDALAAYALLNWNSKRTALLADMVAVWRGKRLSKWR
jgi:hypothetical protein